MKVVAHPGLIISSDIAPPCNSLSQPPGRGQRQAHTSSYITCKTVCDQAFPITSCCPGLVPARGTYISATFHCLPPVADQDFLLWMHAFAQTWDSLEQANFFPVVSTLTQCHMSTTLEPTRVKSMRSCPPSPVLEIMKCTSQSQSKEIAWPPFR